LPLKAARAEGPPRPRPRPWINRARTTRRGLPSAKAHATDIKNTTLSRSAPRATLHPSPYTGWQPPRRPTLDLKSSEDSSAGMRSETAVHRPLTGVTAIEGDTGRAAPQVNSGVVGLAGLEPASSLSGIEGSALCARPFSQVARERQGRRDAFKPAALKEVDRLSASPSLPVLLDTE
jgi:hypothetical protein